MFSGRKITRSELSLTLCSVVSVSILLYFLFAIHLFSYHCCKCVNKSSVQFSINCRLCQRHQICNMLVTLDAAKMIAYSLISSRLDYANALLHGTSAGNLNRLQVAQNSLARVVCQCHQPTSSASLVANSSADYLQDSSHHI